MRKCSAYLLPSADESEGRKRRHLLQPWKLYRISPRLKCNPLVQISLARSIDNMAEEKSGQSGASDTPRKGNMTFTGTKGRRLHPPARTVWAPQICRPRVQSWETDGLYNCQYQQLDLGCIGGTASRIHRCKIPCFQVSEHAKVRIVALNTSCEPPPDLAGLQLRPEEDADALRTNQFPAPGRSPRSSLIIFHPHVRRTIVSGTSLYVTKVKWRCLNSLAPILKRLRRIEYAETLQTSP